MSSFLYWGPLSSISTWWFKCHYIPLKCPRWQVEKIAKMIKMKLKNSSLQLWANVGCMRMFQLHCSKHRGKKSAFLILWLRDYRVFLSKGYNECYSSFTGVTNKKKKARWVGVVHESWISYTAVLHSFFKDVTGGSSTYASTGILHVGVSGLMSTGNWDFSTSSKPCIHPWHH